MPDRAQRDPAEILALTEAAGRGDRDALDQLIEHYQGELRAFVRLRAGPMVRARESASDLVQSVCREVLEHAERFKHPSESAFKRWLFTTALRKIQNRKAYYLAGKRDVLRDIPAAAAGSNEADLLDHYRTFSTPSQGAVEREELERVETAFDLLSEEQREIVTLAHVVGLSRGEIAEQLGKTEVAVRVSLHRALAKLSEHLGGDEGR